MKKHSSRLFFQRLLLVVIITTVELFVFTNCGNRLAGTGIETTNGLVIGRVVGINSHQTTAEVRVRLVEIYMTPSGESLKKEWTHFTDKDGWYRFENVVKGRMVLTAESKEDSLLGVIPRILNPSPGGLVVEDLPMQKKVGLK